MLWRICLGSPHHAAVNVNRPTAPELELIEIAAGCWLSRRASP